MQSVLIVGCGDVGLRVARRYHKRGAAVAGVVRGDASIRRLAAERIPALQVDLDYPVSPGTLPTGGAIVHYYVPPPREGKGDPRIEHFLASIGRDAMPARIVYISTSGVYGDCNGEWVTEQRPPAPDSDRGRRRLAAEESLRRWCEARDAEHVILRVPGIYGPGRLPIKRLKSGSPVVDERECSFSNRIQVDDLVSICVAAGEKGPGNIVYNVSDGDPTTMTEYFMEIADFLGLEPPPVISLDEARELLSPAMLSFLNESKRLDNRLLLKHLKVKLKYPSLARGLPASVPGGHL
ncbi:MAG TPA: SDR family oxidoreductase [Gammaproteobacteria bacterium]|nr:SDR family oxidoreductase [Gammaproteobacteria bacterium]